MEIKASAKYERTSPRKLRLLTKGLTGLSVDKALEKLEFQTQKGKGLLMKIIKQAIANARNNFKITGDLAIKTIAVGEGPSSKRMDKSHGARFDRGTIKKKTAHVFLTLEERGEKTTPVVEKLVLQRASKVSKAPVASRQSGEEKKSEGKVINMSVKEENPPSLPPSLGLRRARKLRRARGTKS